MLAGVLATLMSIAGCGGGGSEAPEFARPHRDVEVEMRLLEETIVAQGLVRAEASAELTVPAVGASPVVTVMDAVVGQTVASGDRVAELSGRP